MTVPTRRRDISATLALAGLSLASGLVRAKAETVVRADSGLTLSAEAIHQEIEFAAPPEKVYRTLVLTAAFDAVTNMSAAARSTMNLGTEPTSISTDPGGKFILFRGYIYGRQIQFIPDRLLVQAWRVRVWPEGVYSIARFEVFPDGAGTKLILDHTGFPRGAGRTLAAGWYENYWNPMRKYLG